MSEASSVRVWLGLGSNKGDSRRTLTDAIERLGSILEGIQGSRFYRTTPQYVLDQPEFLNAVVTGSTVLSPLELLDCVNAVERDFGRDRAKERRKGERTLDIDILLYGDLRMESQRLTIPHPGIGERRFVLVPMLEIDPALAEPGTGMPYAPMLARLADDGMCELSEEQ